MKLIAADSDNLPIRLDVYLNAQKVDISRSSWKKLIDDGFVKVNNSQAKAKYLVQPNDEISYKLPAKTTTGLKPEILYEDEDVFVINKPEGLLVHGKGGLQTEETLVDIYKDRLGFERSNRPGVVHRLDRDTSGVMILAKNTATKTYLQKQFQNRSVLKEYNAVCQGIFEQKEFVIDAPIRRSTKKPGLFRVDSTGKPAVTKVKVTQEGNNMSLVKLFPQTGRTHQLRVHLRYLNHPIIGDRLYGNESQRLMLHAHKLSLAIKHNNYMEFVAPLPKEFSV